MKRYLVLACEVLARPLYLAAATSPNVVDIHLLRRGLHNSPKDLQSTLQSLIDAAQSQDYQALLLGYGLCGNGTAGLLSRKIPLVIPRVHDCIGLLLGSPSRYRQQYDQTPGTYWYTRDFMERQDGDAKFSSLGSTTPDEMKNQYELFVTRYGRENADYLMQVMGSWQSHYERAAFIDLGILDSAEYQAETRAAAAQHGWRFEKLAGDLVMFRQLINGDWQDEHQMDFQVVPPGHQLELTYNDCIFSVISHESQTK
jgi:hypothetical protein